MHDVVVVSDLHLGRGRNPETGRYYSLEAFFYDEDMRRFCRWLVDDARTRGADFRLVFNGDVFDLLRIEPADVGPEASKRERRFGPALTPTAAAGLVAEILDGHPVFVDAVAQVLEAGYQVHFLPGNHDIELQWEPVQAAVRRALVERVRLRGGDEATARAEASLFFSPWFYHEPGRVWIEHGCQYDAESAFRYPLRSAFAREAAESMLEAETDLPLGSFIQRYLYNAFGAITFMVPSTRANLRYFKWLLVNRPALLARVLASHGPFAVQLLRRVAGTPATMRETLALSHLRELAELAHTSGLGQKLVEIDALKQVKHDIIQSVKALGWQSIKFASLGAMIAGLTAGLWFAGFHTITTMAVGFGPKALLFLGLNLFLVLTAIVGVGYALFRSQPAVSTGPLTRAARDIATVLDVPIVSFGHTHDEALWRVDRPGGRKAWYFNTGTWIAVFGHDEFLPRERVQFTFLRVRGMEGELLQWSPGRGEPMPVILLDEEGRGGVPLHPPTAAAA